MARVRTLAGLLLLTVWCLSCNFIGANEAEAETTAPYTSCEGRWIVSVSSDHKRTWKSEEDKKNMETGVVMAADSVSETSLRDTFVYWFIPVSYLVGIAFALMQWSIVSKVTIGGASSANGGSSGRHHPSHGHHSQHLLDSEDEHDERSTVSKVAEIQDAISEGPEFFSGNRVPVLGHFLDAFLGLIFPLHGICRGSQLAEHSLRAG